MLMLAGVVVCEVLSFDPPQAHSIKLMSVGMVGIKKRIMISF